MNAIIRYFPVLLMLIFFITGCHEDDTTGSSNVTTGDIYLDAHFTANGTGDAFVAVQLLQGGSTSDTQVELEGGDTLWASLDETLVNDSINGDLFDGLEEFASKHYKLHGTEEGGVDFDFLFFDFVTRGDILYTSALPYDPGISAYYLSFLRPNGTDAPNSIGSFPEAFDLTAPMTNETHSRVNPIQINWEPSGSPDEVELTASVNCANGNVDALSITGLTDTGSTQLKGGALNGTGIAGNCTTTFEVTKSRLGVLDPQIGSGRVVGHQVRRVTITTSD